MHVVTRARGDPSLDLLVLMGAVIVHDEVDVEFFRNVLVDVLEELQELLVAMSGFTLGQNPARSDLEGRKQRGGAVP